jgi:transcription initiation factor IIE alpha subunit
MPDKTTIITSKSMMNPSSYIVFFLIGEIRDHNQGNLPWLTSHIYNLKKKHKHLSVPTDQKEIERIVIQLRKKGLVAYHENEGYKIALNKEGRAFYMTCMEPNGCPLGGIGTNYLSKKFVKTYKEDIVARLLWMMPNKTDEIVQKEMARQMQCSINSVQRGLDKLEKTGIVEKIKNADNSLIWKFKKDKILKDEEDISDIPFRETKPLVTKVRPEQIVNVPVATNRIADTSITTASVSSAHITKKLEQQFTTPNFRQKFDILVRENKTDIETMILACFNAGYALKAKELMGVE